MHSAPNIIEIVDPKLLGASLRKIRRDKELTLVRVEERLSISMSSIQKLENGSHDIRLSTLVDYANMLGYKLILKPRHVN